jgi:hypothetical protein
MARIQHKPETGGSRWKFFLVDGSEEKERQKVFVSSIHGLKKKQEEQNTDAGGEKSQQEEFQGAARLSP